MIPKLRKIMSTKSTKDTKQIDMLCVLIQFPLFFVKTNRLPVL